MLLYARTHQRILRRLFRVYGELHSFRVIIARDERERGRGRGVRCVLLPETRRYISRRGVITRSRTLSYSYSSRAIIPRDKRNLHIICRDSSEDRLRETCVPPPPSRFSRRTQRGFSVDAARRRDETERGVSLLGKSRGTVNRAARLFTM